MADGSDNFTTRYLLNDTCYRLKKTLVSAAILRFDGQISTYKAWHGAGHPCLRCVFPAAPSEDAVPSWPRRACSARSRGHSAPCKRPRS